MTKFKCIDNSFQRYTDMNWLIWINVLCCSYKICVSNLLLYFWLTVSIVGLARGVSLYPIIPLPDEKSFDLHYKLCFLSTQHILELVSDTISFRRVNNFSRFSEYKMH